MIVSVIGGDDNDGDGNRNGAMDRNGDGTFRVRLG